MQRISHLPRHDGPLPEGFKYVGRPSRWGNRWRALPTSEGLFVVEDSQYGTWEFSAYLTKQEAAARAVEKYRAVAEEQLSVCLEWFEPLRGLEGLACGCPVGDPCHADVLVELLARPIPADK